MLPLGDDINTFDLVNCPKCGQIEIDPELRVFGRIPASKLKLVLGGLLVAIILFGYLLLSVFSSPR
jgi:hypothetical protein